MLWIFHITHLQQATKIHYNPPLSGLKGPDIYRLPLTGKPEQQQFTMRSGVLTSISSRQCSAINGRPLPEQADFGPAVCSQSNQPMPQLAALWLYWEAVPLSCNDLRQVVHSSHTCPSLTQSSIGQTAMTLCVWEENHRTCQLVTAKFMTTSLQRNCSWLSDDIHIRAHWLSWWCSGSASDSWSKGRWFDSRPGLYQVN